MRDRCGARECETRARIFVCGVRVRDREEEPLATYRNYNLTQFWIIDSCVLGMADLIANHHSSHDFGKRTELNVKRAALVVNF